jgi:hypothetical protein
MLGKGRNFQANWQHNLPATPVSTAWGQTLSAHATPHSKGAWTTVIASTTYDVYGFWMCIAATRGGNTRTDMMLDLAIGPNQENIIVPEWLCGWRSDVLLSPPMVYFPIFIPRGTKISARIQALITVDTAELLFFANGGDSQLWGPLFSGCDAYGTAVASSIGTSHTPGNSGAESTLADIGGTLSKNYGAVLLMVQGGMADTTLSNNAYHWKLALGGVERCQWWYGVESNERIAGPFPPTPFYMSLPSGSQLQVNAEGGGTSEAFDVALYCFY